jgi:hypothetical protein
MDTPLDGDVTTAEEFETALDEIVRAATDSGVELEGGWTCNGHDGTVWDVVITEVNPGND